MCLGGTKNNRSLEFYKDAYMINSFGINIPVEKLDILDLGIQHFNNDQRYEFLKVTHNCSYKKCRTIYIIAIQESKMGKWLSSLDSSKLTDTTSLDQGLIQVKKECFDTKNIEYLGEKEGSDSSHTKSEMTTPRSPSPVDKRKTTLGGSPIDLS